MKTKRMSDDDFYKQMLENLEEGIYFVDQKRQITFWNHGAERITGFLARKVIGTYCYDNILNHVDDSGRQLCLSGCPLQATIDDGKKRTLTIYLHHQQGHRIPVTVQAIPLIKDGQRLGAIEVFTDDREKHHLMETIEQLTVIAMKDQLTGLANRRYIDGFVASKITEFQSLGLPFGILFMDIDHFKVFNDTHGHDVGDQVLVMVANTLKNLTRSTDLVGRWGGEEFIAVLPGVTTTQLGQVAEKIRLMIATSKLRVHTQAIGVTISIGATLFDGSDTPSTLFERADRLLYESKSNGRNQVSIGVL